jgi:hypothetical protein
MKTKEEILETRKPDINGGDFRDSEIHAAMEEYAKQEVIAFTEYLNEINQKKYSEGYIERMYNLFKIRIQLINV